MSDPQNDCDHTQAGEVYVPSIATDAANNTAHDEPVRMRDEALHYVETGIPVFPCKPDKSPYVGTGFKAATTDPNQIREWWSNWPNALIGMPTGQASGISVLDLDLRRDAAENVTTDGLTALRKVMDDCDWEMPDTIVVETPSGGYHVHVRHEPGFTNSAGKIATGIDSRGEGGYVILPPSRLPDGRSYKFACDPNAAPTEAPVWLKRVLREHRFPNADEGSGLFTDPVSITGEAAHPNIRVSSAYGLAALDREATDVATAPAGTRNSRLNEAAFRMGQLVQRGDLSRGDVEGRLADAAVRAGLPATEARPTITSGIKSGIAKPREVKAPELSVSGANLLSPSTLIAQPYRWIPGSKIEPRAWLYEPHLIRRYVSLTVAPGGVGKSSLVIADALAMISGKALLRPEPRSSFNVWLFNGEDPTDELERRIAAACQHYHLHRDDCRGQLYVNSGRDTPLIIAKQERDGTKIYEPVVEALIVELKEKKIDVLIVDPFVSSHGVPENDNNAIDQVAKMFAQVADRANCAIELVHHSRKANGTDVGVDDARGASALVAAARSVRTLNRLSPDLAKGRGLDESQTYFSVNYGKANLAPSSGRRDWYTLVPVDIGNGPSLQSSGTTVKLCGDEIGVVTTFEMPDQTFELDAATIRRIQDAVDGRAFRENAQADNWVGHAIARVLGVDVEKERKRLTTIIRNLIASGHFKVEDLQDKNRKFRPCIVVGRKADAETQEDDLRHLEEVERSEVEQ